MVTEVKAQKVHKPFLGFGHDDRPKLRKAQGVCNDVRGQLGNLVQMVEDAALAPMRAVVQQVVGGAWRGDGADAFVNEVTNLMIPGIGKVGESISGVNSNLGRAIDLVDTGDKNSFKLVQEVASVFKDIYR